MNIDEGFLNLMDDGGNPKDDIKIPDNDLGKEIQAKFDKGEDILVTILVSLLFMYNICIHQKKILTAIGKFIH